MKCLSEIKNLVTDVDGVLTDGGFYYDETGKVLKKFGPHDSDGFKIITSLGINCFAISADRRGFGITQRRLNDMGIPISLVSEKERFSWISENVGFDGTCFIGDGYHDVSSIEQATLGIAPVNAPDFVKSSADIVTKAQGGNGVIFEVALMLKERVK